VNVYAIILAGGIGERIKHHLGKQFIKITGKTVIIKNAIIRFIWERY
jgi:2-C-methyl-D-erythritol 4-phosphate cytidylyltransferase